MAGFGGRERRLFGSVVKALLPEDRVTPWVEKAGLVRVMYFNVIRGRYGSENGSSHASPFT